MKIVITGATGFVGKQLLPFLVESAELTLVGRDAAHISKIFSDFKTCDYQSMLKHAQNADAVLHLAVKNNDQTGSLHDFREANIEFLKKVVEETRKAGIKKFIYISTLQTEDPAVQTPYSKTKREAEHFLSTLSDLSVTILRLPAVYGSKFSGRLTGLYMLPNFSRLYVLNVLAALKPTVSIERVAEVILATCERSSTYQKIVTNAQTDNSFFQFCKRTIDLGFAISVLLLFWWLLIILWLAIKLSSDGPGFFAQRRVGRNGQPFICYKFRTMKQGTKQAGTHEIVESSITPIGRFMRRTKLDELPQVWNIIKNEMSLVGPRPCLMEQEELIGFRHKYKIFSITPGITGHAQINNIDMSDPKKLTKWDRQYIDMQTLVMDFKIIISTITGSGQGDKIIKSKDRTKQS